MLAVALVLPIKMHHPEMLQYKNKKVKVLICTLHEIYTLFGYGSLNTGTSFYAVSYQAVQGSVESAHHCTQLLRGGGWEVYHLEPPPAA